MSKLDPFGHSLALVDGDLVLTNGALETVSSKSNLLQALELRVLTPFGSDIFNTIYGLDVTGVFTRPVSLRLMKELIKVSLVRTLGTDPRVHDIRDILFPDDLSLSQTETIALKRSRTWSVQVTIETVNAQIETLFLNINIGA